MAEPQRMRGANGAAMQIEQEEGFTFMFFAVTQHIRHNSNVNYQQSK